MLYSILIYAVDGVFERLPEAEKAAYMEQHKALQEKLKANGSFRGASRLMPPGTAMTVKQQGDAVVVMDGPFAETKEQLAGFYLVDVESMEEALEAAKALPQEIAQMEVRPVMWMSDT